VIALSVEACAAYQHLDPYLHVAALVLAQRAEIVASIVFSMARMLLPIEALPLRVSFEGQ